MLLCPSPSVYIPCFFCVFVRLSINPSIPFSASSNGAQMGLLPPFMAVALAHSSAIFLTDKTKFTRTTCLQVAGEHVLVSHIDYGSEDTLPISSLRPLAPEFVDLPSQAIKCQLHGIPPLHPADPAAQAKSQIIMALTGRQFHCSLIQVWIYSSFSFALLLLFINQRFHIR